MAALDAVPLTSGTRVKYLLTLTSPDALENAISVALIVMCREGGLLIAIPPEAMSIAFLESIVTINRFRSKHLWTTHHPLSSCTHKFRRRRRYCSDGTSALLPRDGACRHSCFYCRPSGSSRSRGPHGLCARMDWLARGRDPKLLITLRPRQRG